MDEEQQPLTPLSRLASPEPSGTPILKPRPSYKTADVFSFGYNRMEQTSVLQEEAKWENSLSISMDAAQEEVDLCKWNDFEPPEKRFSRDQQSTVEEPMNEDATKAWRSVPTFKETSSSPLDEDTRDDGLQGRFMDLFQKITSCSLTTDAGMLKQPLQQMQKKAAERQEHWETKLKEVQKEKYSMSIRLQELEAETPQKRVMKGEAVLLTGEELQRLRQDIGAQEALIHGYQIENEKAVERMKFLQAEAKEKQKLMAEENAALAAQVSNLQLSVRQSLNHGALVDSSSRNAGLEAHARELKMRLENEKLLQVISDLERKLEEESICKKITTLEDGKKDHHDFLAEKIELEKRIEHQAALISHLEEKVDEQQKLFESRLQPDETETAEENETALAAIPENSPVTTPRKLKPVTEQVAHIRSFYIKKVKDLTSKLEEAEKENTRAELRASSKSNEPNASWQVKALRQQMVVLKNTVKSQEETISALRQKVTELESFKDYATQADTNRSNKSSAGSKFVKKKKTTFTTKQDELDFQLDCLSQILGTDVDALKKIVMDTVNGHKSNLQAENLEQPDKKALEKQNNLLEERLKAVTQELCDARSSCSLSPRVLQLKFLKEKIEEMEMNQREKELEWQQILKETKKVYSIEQDMIERKWELALEAKNAEIERFRVELDTILETALKIQAAQLETIANV